MKGKKTNDYTCEFESFWSEYPYRRGSKWNAFGRFKEAVARGVSSGEIITAARRYAVIHFQKETNPQYVPHATTWLQGRCWESIDDQEAELAAADRCLEARSSPVEFTKRAVAEWLRSTNDSGKLGLQPEIRSSGFGVVVGSTR